MIATGPLSGPRCSSRFRSRRGRICGTVMKIFGSDPLQLRAGLEQSARENDRSISAEVRRALAEYLASPFVPGSRGPAGSRTAHAAVEARPERDTEAATSPTC